MIYTGLNRTGEIETVKAHGGYDVAEVYGGIGESNPIYYKTRTITGQTPLSYKALSKPLSDYLISGNTLQDGTPTPSDPVDVVGCGVRTENLANENDLDLQKWISSSGTISDNGNGTIFKEKIAITTTNYTVKATANRSAVTGIGVAIYNSNDAFIRREYSQSSDKTLTFATTTGDNYFKIIVSTIATPTESLIQSFSIMLNSGSTVKPYEPYGFKLPLTVNSTEYPIYLGNVQTTRRIRKRVFDGTEQGWAMSTVYPGSFFIPWSSLGGVPVPSARCTHAYGVRYTASYVYGTFILDNNNFNILIMQPNTTLTEWKKFLSDEYSAGHPVTIWYVLTEPETAVVNEPLMKIGDYADTVSMAQASVTIPTIAGTNTLLVDTTVQPSEVSITGNIKEVST